MVRHSYNPNHFARDILSVGVAIFLCCSGVSVIRAQHYQLEYEQFKLSGNFTLIHWQARPKGHREWGIYSSSDDSYRSQAELTINYAIVNSLQLDDATAKSIPSAVLYTGEDRFTCLNDKTILGNVFLSDVA